MNGWSPRGRVKESERTTPPKPLLYLDDLLSGDKTKLLQTVLEQVFDQRRQMTRRKKSLREGESRLLLLSEQFVLEHHAWTGLGFLIGDGAFRLGIACSIV